MSGQIASSCLLYEENSSLNWMGSIFHPFPHNLIGPLGRVKRRERERECTIAPDVILIYIIYLFVYNSIVTSGGGGIWVLFLLIKETRQCYWVLRLLAISFVNMIYYCNKNLSTINDIFLVWKIMSNGYFYLIEINYCPSNKNSWLHHRLIA